MPLHPDCECRRLADAESLDEPIRRTRFDLEGRRQILHALGVQGIDPPTRSAAKTREQASGLHFDVMCRPVLLLERLRFILAMIELALDFLYALPEGAAEGDVHFLESATDGENRYAGGNRPLDQRKRRSVPICIMQCSRLAGRTSVMKWLDVRFAARKEKAVAALHEAIPVGRRASCRNDHRYRTGTQRNGLDVLFDDTVERVLAAQAAISGNSDERLHKICLGY